MSRWKSILPATGALLALIVAGTLWWLPPAPPEAPLATGERWERVDFTSLKAGAAIPGWDFQQGSLSLVTKDGQTVLQQLPDPMTEGTLSWTQMLPGGGGLRARFSGEKSRRAYPRFALGMHGDFSVHYRTVPATSTQEIVLSVPVEESGKLILRDDTKVTVPWRWDASVPVWLEFRAFPSGKPGGGFTFEGRTWAEGSSRPETAGVIWESPAYPGILRAAVQTAPFAFRPVFCDRIESLRLSP